MIGLITRSGGQLCKNNFQVWYQCSLSDTWGKYSHLLPACRLESSSVLELFVFAVLWLLDVLGLSLDIELNSGHDRAAHSNCKHWFRIGCTCSAVICLRAVSLVSMEMSASHTMCASLIICMTSCISSQDDNESLKHQQLWMQWEHLYSENTETWHFEGWDREFNEHSWPAWKYC